ncbi:MAG: electron transfer flavoprotein subunit alpha/FixB family protein [Proteobacteria bacterium]|nr:electron transfer flavoprotein subunit alpha/FixB family protein [Pseudomonadota bacterium]
MKVLVFCEAKESLKEAGKLVLSDSSKELLKFSIKNVGAENVSAFILGENLASSLEEIKSIGPAKVYSLDSLSVKIFSSDIYKAKLEEAFLKESANLIFASHSPDTETVLAILAAKLETNIATDCLGFDFNEKSVLRSMYSNKLSLKSSLAEGKASFISFRPNSIHIEEEISGTNTEIISLEADSAEARIKCIEFKAAASKEPSLTEAAIIISGGRAMGNSENFSILRELAGKIGAAVGASRAAVDSGYAPHSMQVGQTGKVVSPNLYIASGISGAIQHFAGMGSSKVIVAINTDKDAPILKKADYAIIGDLFEVIPALSALL